MFDWERGKLYTPEVGMPPAEEKVTFERETPSIFKRLKGVGRSLFVTPTAEMTVGATKGMLSTIRGISSLTEKGFKAVLPQSIEDFLRLPRGTTAAEQVITPEMTRPIGPIQKVAKTAEQIGEYFIPAKAPLKVAAAAPRVLKLGAEMLGIGAEFGLKTLAQTGEPKKAATAGLVGLVAPPITKTVKALLYPVTQIIPKRAMSVIFRTAEDDLRRAYRTMSKGQELNPTLAEEALNRGLKGSSSNMAVYSFQKLEQLENQVQNVVKDKTKQIVVENKPAFVNLLRTIRNQFKGTFFPDRAKQADTLIKELGTKGNNVAIDTVLRARRFIDNMRNTSSFRLDPSLSVKQEEFKVAADTLRRKLSDAGLKNLMNEERFYIEALDSIIKDAAKRANKNVLGLFDLIAGGGGMVSGHILGGVTAALAVRGFQQPFTLTNLAQFLYKFRNAPNQLINLLRILPPAIINK